MTEKLRHHIKVLLVREGGTMIDEMILTDNDDHQSVEVFARSVRGVLSDHYETDGEEGQ